ncbi:MAG: transcriptional regulator NanR [Marinosulfonomonas sp.]|nr:MAG: transcriptional regulator NanR [Marinosulfonomonas sp.]
MDGNVTAAGIANILAADIHNGALHAGEMFQPERKLCDRFGVGRGIIRESMTILQGMGLADHTKGNRPRVAAPTLDRVMAAASDAAQFFFTGNEGKAHLDQARLFLETSLLQYAVLHATNAQIGKMVSAVEECHDSLLNVDLFRVADVKFHRALAEVPGNPIFVALHETFVKRMMKSNPVGDDFEEHNRTSNAGHREIVRALLAKDADRAVRALTLHLTRNHESKFHQALENQAAGIS